MKQTPATTAAALPPLSPELKAKITEWNQIKEWLAKGSAREMELRKELVSFFVPKPKEGTNNVQGDGFAVKVGHKVSRSLDEAALDAVMPQLPEHLRVIGTLISYKPAFSMDAYRAMSDADRKIFDQALTIKDGSPTLEIIVGEAAPAVAPETAAVAAKPAKATKTAKPAKPAKQNKHAAKPAKGGKKK